MASAALPLSKCQLLRCPSHTTACEVCAVVTGFEGTERRHAGSFVTHLGSRGREAGPSPLPDSGTPTSGFALGTLSRPVSQPLGVWRRHSLCWCLARCPPAAALRLLLLIVGPSFQRGVQTETPVRFDAGWGGVSANAPLLSCDFSAHR